jgi:hypothetical protein
MQCLIACSSETDRRKINGSRSGRVVLFVQNTKPDHVGGCSTWDDALGGADETQPGRLPASNLRINNLYSRRRRPSIKDYDMPS